MSGINEIVGDDGSNTLQGGPGPDLIYGFDPNGRQANVSSIAALGTGLPGNAFYAATKAEVAILTKRFAMELGPHNITVNAVAPGFVRTDLTEGGRGAGDWQATEARFAAKTMLGR